MITLKEYAVEAATGPVPRQVPRLRADAPRSRERIVTAAREMLVGFGPEVPLDEIARRAGAGNATVYRDLPDRDAPVREVVCSVMDRAAEAAEVALTETGDAFEALSRFVRTAADERITALCPMTQSVFDERHPDLGAARERLEDLVDEAMERARRAGQLRSDIGVGDLMVAVGQLSRPPAGTWCAGADRYPHRTLQLFMDGLRAPAPSALPGTPSSMEDLRTG